MTQIKHAALVFNAIEAALRKAAKETNPVTAQLFMQPEIHRLTVSKGQVRSIVESFARQDVVLKFDNGQQGRRREVKFAWKDDAPTPAMVQRVYQKPAYLQKADKPEPKPKQTELFKVADKDPAIPPGFAESLARPAPAYPTGQTAPASGHTAPLRPPQPVPMGTIAASLAALGFKVEVSTTEHGKRRIVIEEQ